MNRVEAAPTAAPAEVAVKGRPAELEGAALESLGPQQARLVLDRASADPGDGTRVQPRLANGYRPRDVLALQRLAGNGAVNSLLVRRVTVQRDGGAAPADLNVGFNPEDDRNELIRAIDSAQIKNVLAPRDEWRRHIDFDRVVAVLHGKTAAQIQAIDASYAAHESDGLGLVMSQLTPDQVQKMGGFGTHRRTIRDDILGGGEDNVRSDLSDDQRSQVKALLSGTAAAPAAGGAPAAANQRDADAAEIHGLLYGDLDPPEVERVMKMLRRKAAANAALEEAYDRQHVTRLRSDLYKMAGPDALQATMLLNGSTVGADAFKVGIDRGQIGGLDKHIKEIDESRSWTDPMPAIKDAQIALLRKERKKIAEDIERRSQQAAAEGRATAVGQDANAADTAAKARVAAVLGDVAQVGKEVGGPSAAVIRATAEADPGAKAAAALRKLQAEGKLKPEAIISAMRDLRAEAESEAQQRLPGGDEVALAVEARSTAERYFAKLKASWDEGAGAGGPRFDELMKKGDSTEAQLEQTLVKTSGDIDPVTDLILALSGDHKDLETVKRILHDKDASELLLLRTQYFARTNRWLDHDLMGDAPTTAGEHLLPMAGLPYGPKVDEGKAAGSDRLVIEDYLQRPQHEGRLEEANYIWARAEREYSYAIEHRGAAGWWRDAWTNETRTLLDETIEKIRGQHAHYLTLVGWMFPNKITNPGGAAAPEAHELIVQMRKSRATIRNDKAGYERENAKLQATFNAIAMFALQTAFTAILGPIAELALLGELAEDAALAVRVAKWAQEASVGVASTVAANMTVMGDDYSWESFRHDLLTGYGSALGAHAAAKLLEPFAQAGGEGLLGRLGNRCPAGIRKEIVAGAGTVAGVVGADLAVGTFHSDEFGFRSLVQTHLGGKLGEAARSRVKSAISPGEAAGGHPGAEEPAAGEEGLPAEGVAPGEELHVAEPGVEGTASAESRAPSSEGGLVDEEGTSVPETPMALDEPVKAGPAGGAGPAPTRPAKPSAKAKRIAGPARAPESEVPQPAADGSASGEAGQTILGVGIPARPPAGVGGEAGQTILGVGIAPRPPSAPAAGETLTGVGIPARPPAPEAEVPQPAAEGSAGGEAGQTILGVGIAPRPPSAPAAGETLTGVGIPARPPAGVAADVIPEGGPQSPNPARGGDTQDSIAPVPRQGHQPAGRSRFATAPELATQAPVMGRVAYIIDSPAEAAALYVRLDREGQRNILGSSDHDIEMQNWRGDGGQGDPPMAWVRAGDGVVQFSFSQFPRPNLGGYSNEPLGPIPWAGRMPPQGPPTPAPASQPVVRAFARLPEYAASPPLYGPTSKVSHVVTDLQEAQQIWVRLNSERQIFTLEHDGDFAEVHWSDDGGVGEVPIAWVRHGDGVIRFNLAKFTHPVRPPGPGS